MNWWRTDVNKAIIHTYKSIIKAPLTYFSKVDIQQLLCENLRKISTFSKMYQTSLKMDPIQKYIIVGLVSLIVGLLLQRLEV
jgi:hypothetical protein